MHDQSLDKAPLPDADIIIILYATNSHSTEHSCMQSCVILCMIEASFLAEKFQTRLHTDVRIQRCGQPNKTNEKTSLTVLNGTKQSSQS